MKGEFIVILKNYKPSQAVQKAKRSNGGVGLITVINSEKNGRRIEIRQEVAENIKVVDEIAVVYDEHSAIIFAPTTEDEITKFKVKKSGSKIVVYCSQLVDEITEFFSLDFSSTVSQTLCHGRYENVEELSGNCLIIYKENIKEV